MTSAQSKSWISGWIAGSQLMDRTPIQYRFTGTHAPERHWRSTQHDRQEMLSRYKALFLQRSDIAYADYQSDFLMMTPLLREKSVKRRTRIPDQLPQAELQLKFDELVDIWREETMTSSFTHEICMHRAYQQIIGLGPQVLPYIFEQVASGRGHWGWALSAITRENPAEHTDSPTAAAEVWLQWGRERGYCSDQKPIRGF